MYWLQRKAFHHHFSAPVLGLLCALLAASVADFIVPATVLFLMLCAVLFVISVFGPFLTFTLVPVVVGSFMPKRFNDLFALRIGESSLPSAFCIGLLCLFVLVLGLLFSRNLSLDKFKNVDYRVLLLLLVLLLLQGSIGPLVNHFIYNDSFGSLLARYVGFFLSSYPCSLALQWFFRLYPKKEACKA